MQTKHYRRRFTVRRKTIRERSWKTFNTFVAIATIINVSYLGSLITPRSAQAATTVYKSPTANVENASGDQWTDTDPTLAYADGGGAASNNDNERHRFFDFAFGLFDGVAVDGIEVQVDSWSNDSSGCQLGVDLSWNGGSNWSSEKTQAVTGAEATYTLGNSTDPWGGHVWVGSDFANANFRARIRDIDPGSSCNNDAITYVDWLRIRVHYTNNLTITNIDVDGGDTTTVLPGESVSVKVDVTTQGSGDINDWESTAYRIEGGSWQCVDHSDHTSSNSYSETFNVTAPGSNGTYDLETQAFVNDSCNSSTFSLITPLANSIIVSTTPPAANPPLGQSCGSDIALVFDGSGSIDDGPYVLMQNAFNGFVSAFLPGTPTQMSITEFATTSVLRQGFTDNATTLHDEIDEPRVQPGGSATNWEAGLIQARATFDPRPAKPNLVVFASDGNPNRIGAGANVSEPIAVDAAVVAANLIKGDGTRIIALAIGESINTANLEKISSADAVITSSFDSLAADLGALAQQLCPGDLMVNKKVDTNGDGTYEDVNSGIFQWYMDSDATLRSMGSSAQLDAGSQTVHETVVTNHHFVGWNYGSPDDVSCTGDLQSLPINVEVESLGLTEITLCNTLDDNATISGTKTYDWNRNDVTDPGDQPLANWTIKLYAPNWTLLGTTTTNQSGQYSFTGLLSGNYYVCEVMQPGWTYSPNPAGQPWQNDEYCRQVISLGGQEVRENVDFHNYLVGAIHGQKFPDVDADGRWDESAEGLNGWTIFIDQNDNGILDDGEPSMQTQAHDGSTESDNGWYWFQDLQPGTYKVCEVQQSGWVQTYPQNSNDNCHTVTVPQTNETDTCANLQAANAVVTGSLCNFGNQQQASVTVLKNVDMNGDGDTTDAGDVVGATDWTWDINGGNQNYATGSTQFVTPGNTIVSEDLKDGSQFVSVICAVNEDPIQVAQSASVTLNMMPGAHYVCTYTNKIVEPTLTITKTNNTTGAKNPGQSVIYTVIVTNASGATKTAQNVVLTDNLPLGFTYVDGGGATKTFNLGNIAPGASITTTYPVSISATQTAGTYTNTASAKGDNTSLVSATSSVAVVVPQVLGVAVDPFLTLTKTVNDTSKNPGQSVTYTLIVKNTSTADATNVIVTDTLPTGFTFADDGRATKTWTFAILAGGAEQVITYDVIIGNAVTKGSYVNRAFATADGLSPVSAQASVDITVPQVLGLADTGVGFRDYMLFVFGLCLVAAGFVLTQRLRRELGLVK